MNCDETYILSKIQQYRNEPLVPKSVLFVSDYDNRLTGDALAVFEYFSSEKKYDDWKLIWTLPENYNLGRENVFPEDTFVNHAECLLEQSDPFLLKLSTSGWIVTTKCLPNYFIKRDGQKIFGCFDGERYQFGNKVSNLRARYTSTVSKLDYMYTHSSAQNMFLGKPIVGETPLRYTLQSSAKRGEVVVSLSSDLIGNTFEEYECMYNKLTAAIVNRGWKARFFVSSKFWNLYRQENAPDIVNSMELRMHPIQRLLAGAKIFISDNFDEVRDALYQGVRTIYIVKTLENPVQDLYLDNYLLYVVGNWGDALDALDQMLEDDGDYKGKKLPDSKENIYQLLDSIFQGEKKVEQKINYKKEKILFVIPGNLISKFWNLFRYMNQDVEVHILLRSADQGRCWQRKWTLDEEIPLFCKSGPCQTAEEGIYTDVELEMDWKRMIGSQHYDKIVAWDNDDVLYSHLYKKAPTNNLILKNGVGFLEEILKVFHNPLLDIVEREKTELKKVTVDKKLYYDLGQDDQHNKMFLRVKKQNPNWILYYAEKKDLKYNEKMVKQLLQKEKNCNIVVIDSKKFFQKSAMLKQQNIYYMPTAMCPIKLVFASKGAWVEKNGTLRRVLKYLKIPVFPENVNDVSMKITNDGKILGIQSCDEIIDLAQ